MSLTSYQTAPPREKLCFQCRSVVHIKTLRSTETNPVKNCGTSKSLGHRLRRPGSDLLSHALRRSTIGAKGFHGRVRNGIGCGAPAVTTRSSKTVTKYPTIQKVINKKPKQLQKVQAARMKYNSLVTMAVAVSVIWRTILRLCMVRLKSFE